jgi:hypothetical protein
VRWSLALLLAASCGRVGFTARQDASSVDAGVTHVKTASGWTARVLVDLTGIVPYNPNDFFDGGMVELDNAPNEVAALYPPFPSIFAVCAGREIIELGADLAPTVHDYRPATPDTTGPDSCSHLVFGEAADVGAALWIGAGTQLGGDGVYRADATWTLTRDATNNNVNGIGFDPTGAFDGFGKGAVYFADQSDVRQRTGVGISTSIVSEPLTDSMGGHIVLSAAAAYLERTPGSGGEGSTDLDRIAATSHTFAAIALGTGLTIADARTIAGGVPALHDASTLAIYSDDGHAQTIAATLDPAWTWVAVTAPAAPHAFAGSFVVLESNRTLDRDDLLLISPAP